MSHSRADRRLQNEIAHGRFLLEHGAGEIWGWETPAGKLRWRRRVGMLTGHLQPGMRVLELGCGTGYFTRELALTGAEVLAIDISPELLAAAQREVRAENVKFAVDNAYALSLPDGAFDSVVGSSVLHHLEIDRAILELHRVLRPGGVLCFTEPNMLNPQIAAQKNIPSLKKRMGDSPDETAFFRWPLAGKLARAGFAGIQVQPFDFLHPGTPPPLIGVVDRLGRWLESRRVVGEIAGSLHIRAHKP